MSYSGGIAEWSGASVPATEERGWKGQIWTAVNTTIDEPDLSSSDWSLETPVQVAMVSFQEEHNRGRSPLNQVFLSMVSFQEEHIPLPPAVEFGMVSFQMRRNKPYLLITQD